MAVTAVVAVLVAGLAYVGYRVYLNEATDEAVELVPANALFYGNVFFNPSTRQKQALRDLLGRFPIAGTPDEAEGALADVLDQGLEPLDLSFKEDIQPILGRQVAIAVLPPRDVDDNGTLDDDETGVIGYFGTTDPGKAMDLVIEGARKTGAELEEGSYEGTDYRSLPDGTVVGTVENFLVLGDQAADFRAAVDASRGESLASSEEFTRATSTLPQDRVALTYFAWPVAVDALIESGELPPDAREKFPYIGGLDPLAAAVYLRPDGVVMQAAFQTDNPDSTADPGALDDLPDDVWAAAGIHGLGDGIEGLLPQIRRVFGSLAGVGALLQFQAVTGLQLQADVLSWMGDAAGFLRGTEQLEGGLVVETDDPERSMRAVTRLGETLQDRGVPVHSTGLGDDESTFTIIDASIPELVRTTANRERVWVTYGNETTRRIEGRTLAENETFRAASTALEGYSMTGFLDVQELVGFVERTYARDFGSLPPSYVKEVKPNLTPVSFVVMGSRTSNEVTTVRLMIGVE